MGLPPGAGGEGAPAPLPANVEYSAISTTINSSIHSIIIRTKDNNNDMLRRKCAIVYTRSLLGWLRLAQDIFNYIELI